MYRFIRACIYIASRYCFFLILHYYVYFSSGLLTIFAALLVAYRVYDTQKDTLAFTAVDKFLPDQVYYHGCLKSFLQITKWRGPEVGYSERKEESISLCFLNFFFSLWVIQLSPFILPLISYNNFHVKCSWYHCFIMEASSHVFATPCAHQLCVYHVSCSSLYPGIVQLNNPDFFSRTRRRSA